MKKVLLLMPLSTLDWGSKSAGGVDSVCQMLVKYLTERKESGFQYRVLAFDPFCQVDYSDTPIRLSPFVEVIFCPTNEKRYNLPIPGFIGTALRVNEQIKVFKPDVVHSHIPSWMIGVGKSANRLLTLHSYKLICRKSVSKTNDFLYVKVMPWLSDCFIDRYTCVGQMLKLALVQDIAKPISVIGNPIDEAYFQVTRSLNKSDETLRLVTCALISQRKRIDRIIRLVFALKQQGKDVSLTVIGPIADKDCYSRLLQLIAELNLTNDIKFVGRASRDQMLIYYQQSDVGVFLSDQETFGLAPLEMLATGLPVVATRVGVLAEEDFAISGLVLVDGDDLQQKMESVLALNKLITADKMRLERCLNTAVIISQYESLY
ncbi:VpsD family glycosyltransferase [Vibrio anguillarum]|uniref:VpsD family glycosyltransferase n=2 Tax=Vibrio anguillarum TaxID=55601 RepID=UPI000B545BD9|nr:VpsD family glycosyltransferase [Vibrio anguillarum]ASG06884.1 glycosyl transferase family 1 [Vibrio anguillarum]MBF4423915.1 glycosyltransferase [Vibrio anguillarum]